MEKKQKDSLYAAQIASLQNNNNDRFVSPVVHRHTASLFDKI